VLAFSHRGNMFNMFLCLCKMESWYTLDFLYAGMILFEMHLYFCERGN
jgi:hypothetical protein